MHKKSILLLLATLLVLILACSLPAPELTPPVSTPLPPTLTAEAVSALIATQIASFQTATAFSVSPTPLSPTATQAAETASPVPATDTETPLPSITATEMCSDKAELVLDVTVPDGSLFAPLEKFTKTWQLKNTGTCTWTPQYSLVFEAGDPMEAASQTNFLDFIATGSTVDLSVELTAPAENGSYEAKWLVRSADGKKFGIGKEADKPFWIRIKVSSSASDLNLGEPAWNDTFKNSNNWYLLETAYTTWRVKNEHMIMEATPGGGDEWGLSTVSALADFYLEVSFKTGEACSGRDRYGVLVRAPTPNSGYVFGFSCDGYFRIYRWDGTNYSALQEWKKSAEIKAGPNQTNVLGFWAEADHIKLYANGKLLAEFDDNKFSSGRLGLFIGSVNTDPLVIYVEEAAYWDLP